MDLDETLAVVSIGGFAVQRALEVLDVVIVPISFAISKAFDRPKTETAADGTTTETDNTAGWNVSELDVKKWLTAVVGFAIGLLITSLTDIKIVSALNPDWKALDVIIGALAISGGSEGFNSVLKFANHVKEARKVAVRPLPEVKVTPAAATIKQGTRIQILANVAGTDVKGVTWKLLEEGQGAQLDAASGLFSAPPAAGIFHAAAISNDNPEANAVATITVVA